MKIFNNPHFSREGTPSQSMVQSRVGNLENSFRGNKQALSAYYPSSNTQKLQIDVSTPQQLKVDELMDKLSCLQENDEFDVMKSMNNLRGRVLNYLKNYQRQLQDARQDRDKAKLVKAQIKHDALEVLQEYNKILSQIELKYVDEEVNEIQFENTIIKSVKELNKMFNLVEEFLEKFNGRKATLNLYSELINPVNKVEEEELERHSAYDFQEMQSLQTSVMDGQLQDLAAQLEGDMLYSLSQSADAALLRNKLKELKESPNENKETLRILSQSLKLVEAHQVKGEIRRRFCNLALRIKNQLPADHPSRKTLISILFEEAEDEGIEESQWEEWIHKSLFQ